MDNYYRGVRLYRSRIRNSAAEIAAWAKIFEESKITAGSGTVGRLRDLANALEIAIDAFNRTYDSMVVNGEIDENDILAHERKITNITYLDEVVKEEVAKAIDSIREYETPQSKGREKRSEITRHPYQIW